MDVITAILEIDRKAEERIREANNRKDQILNDTETEKQRILQDFEQKAQQELKKIEDKEKAGADQKHQEILESEKAEISRLDGIFEENHTRWEASAFSAIVD